MNGMDSDPELDRLAATIRSFTEANAPAFVDGLADQLADVLHLQLPRVGDAEIGAAVLMVAANQMTGGHYCGRLAQRPRRDQPAADPRRTALPGRHRGAALRRSRGLIGLRARLHVGRSVVLDFGLLLLAAHAEWSALTGLGDAELRGAALAPAGAGDHRLAAVASSCLGTPAARSSRRSGMWL